LDVDKGAHEQVVALFLLGREKFAKFPRNVIGYISKQHFLIQVTKTTKLQDQIEKVEEKNNIDSKSDGSNKSK
jgi:hypothetical protein